MIAGPNHHLHYDPDGEGPLEDPGEKSETVLEKLETDSHTDFFLEPGDSEYDPGELLSV